MQQHESQVHLRRGGDPGHEALHAGKVCVVEAEDEEEEGCVPETAPSYESEGW